MRLCSSVGFGGENHCVLMRERRDGGVQNASRGSERAEKRVTNKRKSKNFCQGFIRGMISD